MQASIEQSTLRLSIALTVVLGVLGVVSGFMTGSQAVIFDGMYSVVDVIPTFVSLIVVKLIDRGPSHRFQYGYWHLEPLVAVMRDSVLAVACIYAGVGAVKTLTAGGHDVSYGLAAIWAGVLFVIGLAMTIFVYRRARSSRSPMLEIDARGWMVNTFLSLALLISFAAAVAVKGTAWQHSTPYLDAGALLLMVLLMLPMPLIGLWRSMREVLQVAPDELDHRVQSIMDEVVKERGFLDYTSYVAKVGRARFVEIHVLVPQDAQIRTSDADAIRSDIARRLNATSPAFWLTIDFTADRSWL